MAEVWLRLAAVVCSLCGMVWLALAMKTHWLQVQRSRAMPAHAARRLRTLGALALASSLALLLWADHGTIAPLVWVMMLTASALSVAFTLATKPRWLSAFVPFLRS
jgi:hypothetical protein